MCEKCDTKRERINKLIDEDPLLNDDDKQGTVANLTAVAIEKVMDIVYDDPFATEGVLRRILQVVVARKLKAKMEDPEFMKELEATQKDLEESLQKLVLENMPEPKVFH